MIIVALVFLVMVFTITYAWVVLTPIYYTVTDNLSTVVGTMVAGDALTILNFVVTVFGYIWQWIVVMLLIGFLVWLYLSAQKKDVESWEVPR